MATTAPDPRGFETWEDAFQYPVPTTRALEKKLRIQINENNDKLRSLVGSSYRELLGTAQTIVDINEQMQKVDSLISRTSRRSDSRILERVARNEAQLEASKKRQDGDRVAAASCLSLLQRALNYVAGILRQKGSLLLAAKLLVISRHLLHETSFGDDVHPFGERMEAKLASLRHRLLRHIDRRLSQSNASVALIVNDLAAFSLATSSTPSNVMAHFQHVRINSIKHTSSRTRAGSIGPADRLRVYTETCRVSRNIFPDLLKSSLKSLSATPLLRDPALQALDELNLNVHEQWVSEKVRNFTPYPRLDELDRQRAMVMIRDWTSRAVDALSESIRGDVEDVSGLEMLLQLRRDTLQAWLSSRQHVRGFSHQQIMHKLRSPFQDRAMALVEQSLRELEESIRAPFQVLLPTPGSASLEVPPQLWEQDLLDMEISDGAGAFRQAVIARRLGRTEGAGSQLTASFARSAETLESVAGHIKRMADTRWDDDYDLDDEDGAGDEAAEADAMDRSVSQMLSVDDPAALRQAFRSNIHASVSRSESWIVETIDSARQDCASPDAPGPFVLRSLRDLRRRIPQLRETLDPGCAQPLFCAELLRAIYARLVESTGGAVSAATLASWASAFAAHSPSVSSGVRALWDGSPPLPVLPSPTIFRYLRAVTKRMEALGADLWSPEAVDLLKARLVHDLAGWLLECRRKLESKASAVANDHHSDAGEIVTAAAAKVEAKQTNQMGLSAYADKEGGLLQQQPDEGSGERLPEPKGGVSATNGKSDGDVDNDDDDDDEGANAAQQGDESPRAVTHGGDNSKREEEREEEEEGKKAQARRWKLTQLAFDARYLEQALSTTAATPSDPAAPAAAPGVLPSGELERAAGLGEAEAARVRRAAAEYWRRSHLLFGLLAY